MRIIVCIKAIKSTLINSEMSNDETLTLNPYDYFALKDILRVKNNCFPDSDECNVTCLSMGTLATKDVLTRCIAFGADQAVLLSDKKFSGADTVATTYVLERAIKKLQIPSLIICGRKSVDGETGQVIYGLAKRLNIACVVDVTEIVGITNNYVVLNVYDEDSIKTIKVAYPALISYKNFTTNYLPCSLLKLKKAKRQAIRVYNLEDLDADANKCGFTGSKTKVVSIDSNLTRKAEKQVVGNGLKEEAEAILKVITRYKMGR